MKVFNSQICTSREQSERLLALGLKKETADMAIEPDLESTYEVYYISAYPPSKRGVPAWSLHRLICLIFNSGSAHVDLFEDDDAYEILIYNIEWRIKEGYFNEEYLV